MKKNILLAKLDLQRNANKKKIALNDPLNIQ